MAYKDELVEKSNERARALVLELKRLDEHRNELTRALSEVMGVLKALGAEDRTPLIVGHAFATRDDWPTVLVTGQRRKVDPAHISEVLSWVGTWRMAKAVEAFGEGRAMVVVKHLLEVGLVVKVGHGRYQRRVELERLTPPKEREVGDESDPKVHMVDGVVTLEPRPERGYGT